MMADSIFTFNVCTEPGLVLQRSDTSTRVQVLRRAYKRVGDKGEARDRQYD
jgi:hypothetical protein